MPDVFTQAKRSEVMSHIRSRGNRDTELALVNLFRQEGITGWRRHLEIRVPRPALRTHPLRLDRGEGRVRCRFPFRAPDSAFRAFKVRPDFVFPKLRLAVFVDGCFWHGCPKHSKMPANNRVFWQRKLAANKARDRRVNRTLRQAGWRVVRIWEHDLARRGESCIRRIRAAFEVPSPTA